MASRLPMSHFVALLIWTTRAARRYRRVDVIIDGVEQPSVQRRNAMSRAALTRLIGVAVVLVGLAIPAEDASAGNLEFAYVCAAVACGDWIGADAECPSGQYAASMDCSSLYCDEGNRIHCVFN